MKINTLNINGNGKSLDLSEKIFSASINKKLMSHILYSLNGNAKLRLAKTKQKNEIKGSTSKFMRKKEQEMQGTQVEKHLYLLVVE